MYLYKLEYKLTNKMSEEAINKEDKNMLKYLISQGYKIPDDIYKKDISERFLKWLEKYM